MIPHKSTLSLLQSASRAMSLRSTAQRVIGPLTEGTTHGAIDATEDFGRVSLGDARLDKRLVSVVGDSWPMARSSGRASSTLIPNRERADRSSWV